MNLNSRITRLETTKGGRLEGLAEKLEAARQEFNRDPEGFKARRREHAQSVLAGPKPAGRLARGLYSAYERLLRKEPGNEPS